MNDQEREGYRNMPASERENLIAMMPDAIERAILSGNARREAALREELEFLQSLAAGV